MGENREGLPPLCSHLVRTVHDGFAMHYRRVRTVIDEFPSSFVLGNSYRVAKGGPSPALPKGREFLLAGF